MAGIKTPGVETETGWPLFAIVGLIVAGIIWIYYETVVKSGATKAVGAASDLVQSAAQLAKAPVDAVTTALKTITASDTPPAGGGPSNSSLFYQGVENFIKSGSIYGSN